MLIGASDDVKTPEQAIFAASSMIAHRLGVSLPAGSLIDPPWQR